MKDFSIIFMGTPEFAVGTLDKLVQGGINVKAVITAADKPAGRGRKLGESAVKKYAVENDMKLLQPTNLKDEDFLIELENFKADLFVVVAFRMLPESVWSMPLKGSINLHASLLPQYRGAAPINWAIMNGEKETGISTFFIEKEIDTGKVIHQAKLNIGENESAGELHNRLMVLGADVMLKTVKEIELDEVHSEEQIISDTDKLRIAPKLFKKDCRIDFNNSVKDIHDFCRGLSPFPGAWCLLYNDDKDEIKSYKILFNRQSDIVCGDKSKISSNSEGLLFPCRDYYLIVATIQVEGKRKMTFKEFLAGNSVKNLSIA